MADIHDRIEKAFDVDSDILMTIDLGNTGLAIGDLTVNLYKNGGTSATSLSSSSLSEIGNNIYWFTVDSSENDTAGRALLEITTAADNNLFIELNILDGAEDPELLEKKLEDKSTKVALQSNTITSGVIDTDAIGASELSDAAANKIADQVWDEDLSGHTTVGSAGNILQYMVYNVWSFGTRTLTSISSVAQSVWDVLASNLTNAGSIGELLVDNVDAAASTISSNVSAVKTKTDNIQLDGSNNVLSSPQTAISLSSSDKSDIVDQVWEEPLADHDAADSMGEAMNDSQAYNRGKRKIVNNGDNEEVYKKNNTTLRHTFNITRDVDGNVTERST